MEKTFGQVMQEWLYGQRGYYTRAHIGQDFYTAVSASRLFGGSIARHILSLLDSRELSLPLHIVEIGAHHGELMCDVYDFLGALGVGVVEQTRFSIIEPLGVLREKARENLGAREVAQAGSMGELALGEQESVFVISNELFDAFACELVRVDSGSVDSKNAGSGRALMACVQCDSAGVPMRLVWRDLASLASAASAKSVARAGELDSHTHEVSEQVIERARQTRDFMRRYGVAGGEIPLGWEAFIAELCQNLARAKCWRFLSFDYAGLGEQMLGEQVFSLRGFLEHRVLALPEIMQNLPELFTRCDVTYNVDFALLERVFVAHGARKLFPHTLAQGRLSRLLVEFGLIELLEGLLAHSPSEYRAQSVRARELLSGSLGEKFMGVCFGV